MNCPTGFSERLFSSGAAYPVPDFTWTVGARLGGGSAVRDYRLCARAGGGHGSGAAICRADGQATAHGGDDGGMSCRCADASLAFIDANHSYGPGFHCDQLHPHDCSPMRRIASRSEGQKNDDLPTGIARSGSSAAPALGGSAACRTSANAFISPTTRAILTLWFFGHPSHRKYAH